MAIRSGVLPKLQKAKNDGEPAPAVLLNKQQAKALGKKASRKILNSEGNGNSKDHRAEIVYAKRKAKNIKPKRRGVEEAGASSGIKAPGYTVSKQQAGKPPGSARRLRRKIAKQSAPFSGNLESRPIAFGDVSSPANKQGVKKRRNSSASLESLRLPTQKDFDK